jgi:hypothetical protein
MSKKYKLVSNKSNDIELKIEKKEKLIKMLKQARLVFSTVALYITCKGIATVDTIVGNVIVDKQPITICTKDGILFFCIGVSGYFFYKINGEIKYQINQYLDLSFEKSFKNIKEEMYQAQGSQKTL